MKLTKFSIKNYNNKLQLALREGFKIYVINALSGWKIFLLKFNSILIRAIKIILFIILLEVKNIYNNNNGF